MQACGLRFSRSQRSSASWQGSSCLPVISALLNAQFGGYPAVVVAELAAHPGNTGSKPLQIRPSTGGYLGNVA